MATHKVPQDVEAEDKLLGPLSLKQLIFTIVGLGFGYLTYFFFANIHPITSVVWLPFTLFFLVLGLYQRKDQPVEVYLAAAARYYFKTRKRVWGQDGYHERVIVTAPVKVEHQYTKGFTGEEAVSRLDNLSSMMDSRGWSAKLAGEWQNPQFAAAAGTNRLLKPTTFTGQATQPIDIQDQRSSPVARAIEQRIDQSASTGKQHALQALQRARNEVSSSPTDGPQKAPVYQKYPESMHQKIINPKKPSDEAQQKSSEIPTPQSMTPQQPIPLTFTDLPQRESGNVLVDKKADSDNESVEISIQH